MLLGAHISIEGGVHKAPERAREMTCDCMQIFSKNQRQWKAKPLAPADAERFKENCEEHKIRETVIHDSYLINLGSPDAAQLKRSRETFLEEITRAERLGVRHLIFHPGSHVGSGEKAGLEKISESLNWARGKARSDRVVFLLETTAGQGTNLGYSFEQLAKVIDMLEEPKASGICFDTCHAYAAGYDIKTKSGYRKTFDLLDDVLGIDRVKAFHLNDTKGKLGSRLDRHEEIGEGYLGLDCFKMLMNDSRWEGTPMVLETPKAEETYVEKLAVLRSLIRE